MAYNQYGQFPQYGGFNQFQNQYQQQKSNMEWIMVPTVSDVEKVQVQPGSKAWIMVQNEAIFALRTADQMGLVTTDMYTFEKYQAKPVASENPEWVTKGQMESAIASAIEGLKGVLLNESSGSKRGKTAAE